MSEKTPLYALIPSYEPTDVLVGLAAELKDAGFSVLIVDDGSGDPLSHSRNRKQGGYSHDRTRRLYAL